MRNLYLYVKPCTIFETKKKKKKEPSKKNLYTYCFALVYSTGRTTKINKIEKQLLTTWHSTSTKCIHIHLQRKHRHTHILAHRDQPNNFHSAKTTLSRWCVAHTRANTHMTAMPEVPIYTQSALHSIATNPFSQLVYMH